MIFDKITESKKRTLLTAFLIALIVGAASILYLVISKNVYFFIVDDYAIRKALEGAAVGGSGPFAPLPLMLISNVILGLIFSAFYIVFPYVPWYFIFLVITTLICYTLILYSILRLTRGNVFKLIIATVSFVLFLLFGNYYLMISYTYTPTLAIVAGFLNILSIDFDAPKKEKIFNAVTVTLEFFIAYAWRVQFGYIFLALFVAVMLVKLVFYKVGVKKTLHVVVPLAICFTILLSANIIASETVLKDYYYYNLARSTIYDFYDYPPYEGNEEFYESIGADENAVTLWNDIFYMYEDVISKEQLESIAEYQASKSSFFEKIFSAAKSAVKRLVRSREFYLIAVLFIGFSVLAVMGKDYKRLLLIIASAIVLLALYYYLHYIGRAPERATMPITMSSYIFITYLALSQDYSVMNLFKSKKVNLAAKCVVALAVCLFSVFVVRTNVAQTKATIAYNTQEAKDNEAITKYVNDNPDNLYVVEFNSIHRAETVFYNNNSSDCVNFVTRSGWESHYPAYYECFKKWGMERLTIEEACGKDVYIAIKGEKVCDDLRAYLAVYHADKELVLKETVPCDDNFYYVYAIAYK